jgi:hypothetical protein
VKRKHRWFYGDICSLHWLRTGMARRRRDMDRWLWAYTASTIWPIAVLLCAPMFPRHEDISSRIDLDIGRDVGTSDLDFYVAMVTAAHL